MSTLSLMIFVSILVSIPNSAGTCMEKSNYHTFVHPFVLHCCILLLQLQSEIQKINIKLTVDGRAAR